MPRTVWTKPQSDPNGTWSRYEGEPPFSIPATAGLLYEVRTDTGDLFLVTPQSPAGSALTLTGSGPDSVDLMSNAAGTLYYGIYPAGTTVANITIADLVTGTDTGQIEGGTAGVFVASGALPDISVTAPALPSGTDYVVAFVLDIGDAGVYSNLIFVTFTASVALTASYVGETTSANNGTGSYGFSGVAVGQAAADREVYVVVQFYGNLAVSSVGFNGGAASDTNVIQSSGNTANVAIARALVPAGTTADIDVTLSSVPDGGVKISIFRVTGKSGETAGGPWITSNQAPPQSGTMTVATGGAVIAGAGERGSVGDAPILTGAAQVGTTFDTNSEDVTLAGLATDLTADAAYPVGVSKSGGGNVSGVFIALE